MSVGALWWLLFNFFTIAVNGFYSMMEMACVSFNPVRLQYYVTKGIKQAVWLNSLLHNPTRLFGTTLIGVNVATVVGSECAREFYSAIGLSPDLSPLTQVFLVVILADLAPMFAARRYPEHVVMLGMPLLYGSARAMAPLLWAISLISRLCQIVIGGDKTKAQLFLTKEELVHILEEQDEEHVHDEFHDIAANIFTLRYLSAQDIMEPLAQFKILPSNTTVKEMRDALRQAKSNFYFVYHRNITNIVSIAYPRDMIRATEKKRVRDFAKSPWFIARTSSVMEVLQQFRRNRENVAIVINASGEAVGVVTLDRLMDAVVSASSTDDESEPQLDGAPQVVINKTLSGSMLVGQFNDHFEVILDPRRDLSLAELISTTLGHHPDEGDSIFIEPYQLTVAETSLTDVTEVVVSTKIK